MSAATGLTGPVSGTSPLRTLAPPILSLTGGASLPESMSDRLRGAAAAAPALGAGGTFGPEVGVTGADPVGGTSRGGSGGLLPRISSSPRGLAPTSPMVARAKALLVVSLEAMDGTRASPAPAITPPAKAPTGPPSKNPVPAPAANGPPWRINARSVLPPSATLEVPEGFISNL